MKLEGFETHEDFKDYTFINEADLKVIVTIDDDGNKTLVVHAGVTFEEVREVMALVESGKIEIEIGE